jgi:hypothetical protein
MASKHSSESPEERRARILAKVPDSFKHQYDISSIVSCRYYKEEDQYIIGLENGEKIRWKDIPVETPPVIQESPKIILHIPLRLEQKEYQTLCHVAEGEQLEVKEYLAKKLWEAVYEELEFQKDLQEELKNGSRSEQVQPAD